MWHTDICRICCTNLYKGLNSILGQSIIWSLDSICSCHFLLSVLMEDTSISFSSPIVHAACVLLDSSYIFILDLFHTPARVVLKHVPDYIMKCWAFQIKQCFLKLNMMSLVLDWFSRQCVNKHFYVTSAMPCSIRRHYCKVHLSIMMQDLDSKPFSSTLVWA